jgi:glycine betaine catabolism A
VHNVPVPSARIACGTSRYPRDVPAEQQQSQAFPPVPLDPDDVASALLPFGFSRMLPRRAYSDAAVLDWERQAFFERGWVCIGRSSDVPMPGDQVALQVGSHPLVLTRDLQDGRLHVVANICRHRGHELLACGQKANRGVLQCPYHAWSYELDGTLRMAPRFDGVPAFEPAAMGLARIRHVEWAGWVFVDVSGSAPPFHDVHAGLDEQVRPWAPERLVPAATHRYELAANWKLVHENYNECYHCPLIHPELCRVSPPDSGDNVQGQRGAWVGGAMQLREGARTMSFTGASPVPPLPSLPEDRHGTVVYFSVFPNLLVSLHPDYVMTHRLEPVAPGRTIVTCEWLFDPAAVAGDGFDPGFATEFWDLTNRQDWAAVESVQRSMASTLFEPGLLAVQEDSVYQFVTMVARGYQGLPVGPADMPEGFSRRR